MYLDYENLAIGARDQLRRPFDFGPVADALAERGRVIVRRAYADWMSFADDARSLTRHQVELVEMPQQLGANRKNAADIKMAVDALESAYTREHVTTFVIGTGDSDFTPLVHKLRELDKVVIGLGVRGSTSALLPPACDEYLYYERLEGVDSGRSSGRDRSSTEEVAGRGTERHEDAELDASVLRTLAGLASSGEAVRASTLKRAMLRKDPTFSEADYGYRAFGELIAALAGRGVVDLSDPASSGDPRLALPSDVAGEIEAFELLRKAAADHPGSGPAPLSGLKSEMRRRSSDFNESRYGYSSFLQFCRSARARGYVELNWDDDRGDWTVTPAAA